MKTNVYIYILYTIILYIIYNKYYLDTHVMTCVQSQNCLRYSVSPVVKVAVKAKDGKAHNA